MPSNATSGRALVAAPRRRSSLPAVALALLTLACGGSSGPSMGSAQPTPAGRQQGTVAFVGVHVLPMDAERVLRDHTVVVRDGVIREVGPAGSVQVPADATLVQGNGRYLLPGLAEMHGHLPGGNAPPELVEQVLFLYAARGVTLVRGMQGHPSQLDVRRRIEQGALVGPRLFVSSPPYAGQNVPDAATAARLVREHDAAGYDLLKVHEGLSLATYDAIAATAAEVGIPFGGHVAEDVGLWRAIEAGQASIDHMDGYLTELGVADPPIGGDAAGKPAVPEDEIDEALEDLAGAAEDGGVWHVPTLALWETFLGGPTMEELRARPELRYVPEAWVQGWEGQLAGLRGGVDPALGRRIMALRQRVLRALRDEGAGIILGSDAPQIFSVPGFSIHREMEAMARAGLTPFEILASGTRDVARYFGAADEFGTVAPGHRADLLLVDGNPLEDVANAANIEGVMLAGRWLPAQAIEARLAGYAR